MRKSFLFFIIFFCCRVVPAQDVWTTTGIPVTAGRYDDIFFINDSVGWAVGGNHKIYNTSNGGRTWQEQLSPGKYLRSVEFLTGKLGFCGSLDTSLYRTSDGGKTWTDIASSISPRPVGFCGLESPDSMTIYGCGIWRTPAYLIRSIDQGNSWTYIDMSAYATALVDMLFSSKDTGFAIGTANPSTDGGIILYTTNGGASWITLHKTGVPEDIIWKIQTPDSKNYYASISANPITKNARVLKSTDGGLNWNTILVRTSFEHLQVVGFIDSLNGWTGDGKIFETNDGGQNWYQIIPEGAGFNRFFRVNSHIAYMSAQTVYKRSFGPPPPTPPVIPTIEYNSLRILPNPTPGTAKAELKFRRNTFASLTVYSSDGKKISQLLHSYVEAGEKLIPFDLSRYPAGTYFVVLRTNEGLIYQQVVRM